MSDKDLQSRGSTYIWYSVGSTIYMFSLWIITILIVRISGYADAGLLSLTMTSTNVFFTISIWGMRSFQVSDIKEGYSNNTYIVSRFVTSAAALFICVAFALINRYQGKQLYSIMIFMIFKTSEAIVDVYNGIDQKKWRMDIIGKSYTIRGVLIVAFFTATIMITKNIILSLISITISSYAVIIIYDIRKTNAIAKIKLKLKIKHVDKLLLECLPLVICNFLYTFIAFLPRYFLEAKAGDEALGVYSSIASPVLIIQLLSSFMFSPLITVFSQYFHNNDMKAFKKLLLRTTLFVTAISLISIAIGNYFGRFGLIFLYGEQIGEYSYLVIPTIVTVISTTTIWLLNGVITAIRKIKYILYSAIIGTIICIVTTKIFIDKYNLNGINISITMIQIVQIIIMTVVLALEIKAKETTI